MFRRHRPVLNTVNCMLSRLAPSPSLGRRSSVHGARIHAQVRTWEPHRPSLLLQARDSGRVGRTCLRGECECNGNATVVLPVSNDRRRDELPFPLLMFSPPATGAGHNKCKCSRCRARESRKSRVHTLLISRSRNLDAKKHAKTSCGYAAATLRLLFALALKRRRGTPRKHVLPAPFSRNCLLYLSKSVYFGHPPRLCSW